MTWEPSGPVHTGGPGHVVLSTQAADPGCVWVGLAGQAWYSRNGDLYHTQDHGENWTRVGRRAPLDVS